MREGLAKKLQRCNFGLGGGQIIRPSPTASGRRVRQNAANRSCFHLSSARDTFAINASANLALGIMDRMGVKLDHFGDANTRLQNF